MRSIFSSKRAEYYTQSISSERPWHTEWHSELSSTKETLTALYKQENIFEDMRQYTKKDKEALITTEQDQNDHSYYSTVLRQSYLKEIPDQSEHHLCKSEWDLKIS